MPTALKPYAEVDIGRDLPDGVPMVLESINELSSLLDYTRAGQFTWSRLTADNQGQFDGAFAFCDAQEQFLEDPCG